MIEITLDAVPLNAVKRSEAYESWRTVYSQLPGATRREYPARQSFPGPRQSH